MSVDSCNTPAHIESGGNVAAPVKQAARLGRSRQRLHLLIVSGMLLIIAMLFVGPDGLTAASTMSAPNAASTPSTESRKSTESTARVPNTTGATSYQRAQPADALQPARVPNAPMCGPDWAIVSSPNPGSLNDLNGVAAASPNDVWAVGGYAIGTSGPPLVEHWDGTAWSVVPSPNEAGRGLNAVAVVSPNDVWAVGNLIEHWDGSAWSIVPPNPSGMLYGVAAASSNDVWAVGDISSGSTTQTLVQHWDGTAWSIVYSPNPGPSQNHLYGVAVASPNDVWAVGEYWDGSNYTRTLVEHWDGSAWTVVSSPNQRSFSELRAVAVVSADDVWAVGIYNSFPDLQTLVEHWDGSAWSIIPSPSRGPGDNFLYGVAAASSNDVWAVGRDGPFDTLVEHWDGTAWSVVNSPNQAGPANFLYGIAVVSPTDVWAVGNYQGFTGYLTLVERYNPCTGAPTPTRAPTPRSTPTPHPTMIPTAAASPTPCSPGVYSDVPPGSTFYPFITCLATRGTVGGYSDCTFRPGSNITRGQIAKMVSNAANYQDPVPSNQQTYTDVPPTNPFWVWIERLTLHNVMSGYSCGGAGEPCDLQQRPYFRWSNNATRGQLSKIVSNAADIQDTIPSTQQTFEDVPYTNTFWLWIERLASRGVMGGYTCGTPPAGQCVPPQNRPYFLPFNNVTRGQASKIVANTFYPNCQTPR